MHPSGWFCMVVLWAFGSALAYSADPNGKPDTVPGPEGQIAFEVKKGWVSFTLTKEGKGIPDALVEALDEDGVKFAEGTTGSKGQGQFPLPKGHQIKIEVKIGERSANTIVLTRIGDSAVVPQEVLLSYGSKPCCKWGPFTWEEDQDAVSWIESFGVPAWLQMLIGASLIVGGTFWAYRLGQSTLEKRKTVRSTKRG